MVMVLKFNNLRFHLALTSQILPHKRWITFFLFMAGPP